MFEYYLNLCVFYYKRYGEMAQKLRACTALAEGDPHQVIRNCLQLQLQSI